MDLKLVLLFFGFFFSFAIFLFANRNFLWAFKQEVLFLGPVLVFGCLFFPSMLYFYTQYTNLLAEKAVLTATVVGLQQQIESMRAAARLAQNRTEVLSDTLDYVLPVVIMLTAFAVLTLGVVLFVVVRQSNTTHSLLKELQQASSDLDFANKNSERLSDIFDDRQCELLRSIQSAKITPEVLLDTHSTLVVKVLDSTYRSVDRLDHTHTGLLTALTETKKTVAALTKSTSDLGLLVRANAKILEMLNFAANTITAKENSSLFEAFKNNQRVIEEGCSSVSSKVLSLQVNLSTKLPEASAGVDVIMTALSVAESGAL